MTLLEVLQFVGYGAGAFLTLWMGALLLRVRRNVGKLERLLLALAIGIGVWHASNLVLTLHSLLGLDKARWLFVLRVADSLAVISITLSYSFLLHGHLYLWARARSRKLTWTEHARVYLSYVPALFLFMAVPALWKGDYEPMLVKLGHLILVATPQISYVEAFMLWAVYVLTFVGVTNVLIARITSATDEKKFTLALATSFFVIAMLILAVYVIGVGQGTSAELYLTTLANLGSLLPTALMAHRIYRYRYLDLMIRESLVVATFAAVVLVVYLFGIRAIGVWATTRYNLREGVVESLLIVALALMVSPLRKWLEQRFHRLFEREASLYREVVARIGTHGGQYQRLSELLHFVEVRTAEVLGLRRVRLIATAGDGAVDAGSNNGESPSTNGDVTSGQLQEILETSSFRDWSPVEGLRSLKRHGYQIAYPMRREERVAGVMLIDAVPDALTSDVRSVLEVLAGQVAIAIEDSRLVEANVQLERKVAQGERLAALGQMAATVAHEVRNPLSAIKSIAQVMREDEGLRSYAPDLNVIVRETDRLNSSVTQLLSFARRSPEAGAPCRADELIEAVIALYTPQGNDSGVTLRGAVATNAVLSGDKAAALRDALSNLLLNALQATPAHGSITVAVEDVDDKLRVRVADTGSGIPAGISARMWEPFFTTKQRGTGLGLAIVRKRIEDVGGTTNLLENIPGHGARFEIVIPVAARSQ